MRSFVFSVIFKNYSAAGAAAVVSTATAVVSATTAVVSATTAVLVQLAQRKH